MEQKSQSGRGASEPSTIRFGAFELDLRAAELWKNGHKIRLQEQPFQILVELLERPGEVVLREEIRRKLLPNNTVVEFDHSINAAVKRLRDSLQDSAERPRYIETLARRGYRFIGRLETASAEEVEAEPDEPAAAGQVTDFSDSAAQTAFTQGVLKGQETVVVRRLLPARALLSAVAAAVLLLAITAVWYHRTAPGRWVRKVALPEVTRLVNAGNYPAAFPLLYRGLQILPDDPTLNRIRREISYAVPVRITPSGASVYLKP